MGILKKVKKEARRIEKKTLRQSNPKKLVCRNCETVFSSEAKSDEAGDLAKVATGAGVGAYMGSSVGIAALGTAVSGVLPLALLGGGLAYILKKKKFKCTACGHTNKL